MGLSRFANANISELGDRRRYVAPDRGDRRVRVSLPGRPGPSGQVEGPQRDLAVAEVHERLVPRAGDGLHMSAVAGIVDHDRAELRPRGDDRTSTRRMDGSGVSPGGGRGLRHRDWLDGTDHDLVGVGGALAADVLFGPLTFQYAYPFLTDGNPNLASVPRQPDRSFQWQAPSRGGPVYVGDGEPERLPGQPGLVSDDDRETVESRPSPVVRPVKTSDTAATPFVAVFLPTRPQRGLLRSTNSTSTVVGRASVTGKSRQNGTLSSTSIGGFDQSLLNRLESS